MLDKGWLAAAGLPGVLFGQNQSPTMRYLQAINFTLVFDIDTLPIVK